jgi:hypothetical protein
MANEKTKRERNYTFSDKQTRQFSIFRFHRTEGKIPLFQIDSVGQTDRQEADRFQLAGRFRGTDGQITWSFFASHRPFHNGISLFQFSMAYSQKTKKLHKYTLLTTSTMMVWTRGFRRRR